MATTTKNHHDKHYDRGIIYVEFAMALTLLLIIVLGMAQQYISSLTRLYHYSLMTELMMGPQEKSMVFDSASGTFLPLSSSTTPTDQQFYDTIGNFLLSRFPDQSYAVYMKLAYLNIDPDSGAVIGKTMTTAEAGYVGSAATGCNNVPLGELTADRLADARTNSMIIRAQLNTPDNDEDDTSRYGIKLYDFKIEDSRYRQYANIMPIIAVYMCSAPLNITFAKKIITYHAIAPRRLIN